MKSGQVMNEKELTKATLTPALAMQVFTLQ